MYGLRRSFVRSTVRRRIRWRNFITPCARFATRIQTKARSKRSMTRASISRSISRASDGSSVSGCARISSEFRMMDGSFRFRLRHRASLRPTRIAAPARNGAALFLRARFLQKRTVRVFSCNASRSWWPWCSGSTGGCRQEPEPSLLTSISLRRYTAFMPLVRCAQCHKSFHVKPSWIKLGYGKYCSSACQYKGSKTGKVITCFLCKKEAYRPKKQLTKSKSGRYFCGKSCQTIWRNQLFRGEQHPNWKEGKHVDYRQIMEKESARPICRACKSTDVRVLCVHHLDQNRRNNSITNLAWLCYNCHHLVHAHHVRIQ